MTHTYPKQFEPTVEVGTCNKPTCYVRIMGSHVLAFCTEGHLIKGKIYTGIGAEEKSYAVAIRLKQWIETSK